MKIYKCDKCTKEITGDKTYHCIVKRNEYVVMKINHLCEKCFDELMEFMALEVNDG